MDRGNIKLSRKPTVNSLRWEMVESSLFVWLRYEDLYYVKPRILDIFTGASAKKHPHVREIAKLLASQLFETAKSALQGISSTGWIFTQHACLEIDTQIPTWMTDILFCSGYSRVEADNYRQSSNRIFPCLFQYVPRLSSLERRCLDKWSSFTSTKPKLFGSPITQRHMLTGQHKTWPTV